MKIKFFLYLALLSISTQLSSNEVIAQKLNVVMVSNSIQSLGTWEKVPHSSKLKIVFSLPKIYQDIVHQGDLLQVKNPNMDSPLFTGQVTTITSQSAHLSIQGKVKSKTRDIPVEKKLQVELPQPVMPAAIVPTKALHVNKTSASYIIHLIKNNKPKALPVKIVRQIMQYTEITANFPDHPIIIIASQHPLKRNHHLTIKELRSANSG